MYTLTLLYIKKKKIKNHVEINAYIYKKTHMNITTHIHKHSCMNTYTPTQIDTPKHTKTNK